MEPFFLGQIVEFGGNFEPRGYAFCNGQMLSIAENTALFSILGTIYGGDGRTTFALPDLRGRIPIHPGNGPGLSSRRLGEKSGVENVMLNVTQIPSHTHPPQVTKAIKVVEEDATTNEVAGKSLANSADNVYSADAPNADLNPASLQVDLTIGNTGGNQDHTNMPPFECVNYVIALIGPYPSRN